MENKDFLMEHKLKNDAPQLHEIFKNCVFVMTEMLDHYKNWFPTYTDHSINHSLNVIYFCNTLIGEDNLEKLNPDEIFILLLGCYLHDSGMGVSKDDFFNFITNFPISGDIPNENSGQLMSFIRKYHHELSGQFIKKYGPIFEIPSKEHIHAIIQTSRGHRKTDLFDEKEYPTDYILPNGNTVCLPYLAALIRLADEVDIARDRNSLDMYEIKDNYTKKDIEEFGKHKAIKHIDIEKDCFVAYVETDDDKVFNDIKELMDKIQKTLDYCVEVVEKRTPFNISQRSIVLKRV